MSSQPTKIATLISGGGRTVQNLAQWIDRGDLDARIVAVISSRGDVRGIQRARDLGLAVHVVERKQHKSPADFAGAIWPLIDAAGAHLVCLCGFLSILPIPAEYLGKVLNIHPALLPKFGGHGMYGHHVHDAVLAAGETTSGCTVHFCDNEYDTGPIILQRTCPVMKDDTADTLAARVFEQECIAYPEAIKQVIAGSAAYERPNF